MRGTSYPRTQWTDRRVKAGRAGGPRPPTRAPRRARLRFDARMNFSSAFEASRRDRSAPVGFLVHRSTRGFERRVHRGLKQHENLLPALFPNEVFCVRLHKSFLAAGRDRSFRERFSLFRARLPNSPPLSRPASRVTSTSPARTTGATTTTSWTYVPDRPVSRVPSLAARAS